MLEELPTTSFILRCATQDDITTIDYLDSFSASPTRDIHRAIEQYFGSIDPSTHQHTIIYLAEFEGTAVAKAEFMLPSSDLSEPIGYVKRVIVHPNWRGRGLARLLMQHIITQAHNTYHLAAVDLYVWEENQAAIRLYEQMGFQLRHRERYYRLPLSPE